MSGIAVVWAAREPPLAAVAVAAQGEAARALARRLLDRDPAELLRLRGVAGHATILLLGKDSDLPWADGAIYLGVDPAAPSLLLPCTRAPSVPAALLERAIAARGAGAPIALLASPSALIPVAAARPVSRACLASWLEG